MGKAFPPKSLSSLLYAADFGSASSSSLYYNTQEEYTQREKERAVLDAEIMAQEQNSEEQEQKRQRQQRQEEEDEDEEKEESPAPSKAPRVSTDKSWDADTVTTAVASPLVLGLGLSVGTKEREEVGPSSSSSAKAGFTFMQMQEFHHQALIFKHMVAGIPVPIHLILPIWKSVAASYGPHHYPSFVGLGNLCYDFRNSMEPEPGRCRRTDGKKWRCSRDVVPEQKYCERHMHRGRNRSRKPVEATAAAAAVGLSSPSSPPPPPVNNNSILSITIADDDVIPSTNSTGNLITSSNALTARIIGSSPTSVLSATPACKTGAS